MLPGKRVLLAVVVLLSVPLIERRSMLLCAGNRGLTCGPAGYPFFCDRRSLRLGLSGLRQKHVALFVGQPFTAQVNELGNDTDSNFQGTFSQDIYADGAIDAEQVIDAESFR